MVQTEVTGEGVCPHLLGQLTSSQCHESVVQTQLQASTPRGGPEVPLSRSAGAMTDPRPQAGHPRIEQPLQSH